MSVVTHHFVSGSDFAFISPDAPPIAGMLLMKDGGAQVFLSDPPDPDDVESLELWGEACDVTEYLLYAMERSDWIIEYHNAQRDIWLQAMAEKDRKNREALRSTLRVIQGGKSDSDPE